jgi:hypothetical protein
MAGVVPGRQEPVTGNRRQWPIHAATIASGAEARYGALPRIWPKLDCPVNDTELAIVEMTEVLRYTRPFSPCRIGTSAYRAEPSGMLCDLVRSVMQLWSFDHHL